MSTHHNKKIVLALRGTLAALTALVVARFLEIENPYWAAMTALIVIQPTRGLIFEKSFYRLVGTVLGSLAALLLLESTSSPFLLTLALVIWISGCVGIGNLLYGLRSYAFLMAACTCGVLVMSGVMNPLRVHEIVFGRIACIVIGILVTTVVTALFTPRSPRQEVERRLETVTTDAVLWLAALLGQGRNEKVARLEHALLMELADLEACLDPVGAASPGFRKRKRQVKALISALLSLLAAGRLAAEHLNCHRDVDGSHQRWRELLSRRLSEAVGRVGTSADSFYAELEGITAHARSHLPLLGETLGGVVDALGDVLGGYQVSAGGCEQMPPHRLIRHRDWMEAGRAAFRSGLVIAVVGFVWSVTGWSKGPLMLMALSIMITIFSTKDHPAHFVGNIFVGAAIGSATAVLCRIFLLSAVGDPYLAVAAIAPFVLLGFIAMQYPATVMAATDATLFFLFVVQPATAINATPVDLALGAVAAVAGVGMAWASYALLVPINPARRMQSVLAAVSRDLGRMARTGSSRDLGRIQARLQHRVIRLVGMAVQHDPAHQKTVDGGVTALGVAAGIKALREKVSGNDLPPASDRVIREVLMVLAALAPQQEGEELLTRAASALYKVLQVSTLTKGPVQTAVPGAERNRDRQLRQELLVCTEMQ
ncbi:FUSC family protein [Geomonas anaerohicana]|uniref:FUSC family protein n=1 Tax=Geomonas anaerohicana TaxID=2798583 RepID=A0ABS0YBU8_9BACT|nr:FUSC family protein [Geomonas anaerohicana]MBJ6749785.1 FUSC family protein [Geomonas anaerohicana]